MRSEHWRADVNGLREARMAAKVTHEAGAAGGEEAGAA
jgi:hypothetical protein